MTNALSTVAHRPARLPPLTLAGAVRNARNLCTDLGPNQVREFGQAFHEMLFACPPVAAQPSTLGMATAGGEIVPTDLKVLLFRCLASDPEVRPASLDEVVQELAPHTPAASEPPKRRNRFAFAFGMLALGAGLAFGLGGLGGGAPTTPATVARFP